MNTAQSLGAFSTMLDTLESQGLVFSTYEELEAYMATCESNGDEDRSLMFDEYCEPVMCRACFSGHLQATHMADGDPCCDECEVNEPVHPHDRSVRQ